MRHVRLLWTLIHFLMAWTAFAVSPETVLGPGLNAGRTSYHQQWNRTLSADTAYVLTGLYYVDSTFSLTIQPGTVVFADSAATLIITRGARIFALGNAAQPVVFTSNKPAGSRIPGDWGGVMILGRAPVNKVEPLIEGGIIGGTYGGTDPADTSGIFRYVRIEYAGYRFQLNNETNGLTMGGVGRGTELHHVQVSYANDDSYEWFGGTVNAKHLVAFGGVDDEFDSDFGWQGKIQFGFGLRDLNNWDPTGESNGFESDNDGSATSIATPYSQSYFSNITLIGPERSDALVGNLPPGNKFQYSALLRRSTGLSIYNSVLAGYPWGLRIRDVNTITHATIDTLQIRNTSIAASQRPSGSSTVHDSSQWPGIAAWYNTAAFGNTGSSPRNPSAVGLTDMSNLNSPNPVPAAGSELIGSASFSNPRLSDPFFDAVMYRGAFDPAVPMSGQWTAGWTNFDPQNTDYRNTTTGIDGRSGNGITPSEFSLAQNYPNPFNPQTEIVFRIAETGRVRLAVYDIVGREVAVLADDVHDAGSYAVTFDAEALASGTYVYRLTANGFSRTMKMLVLK